MSDLEWKLEKSNPSQPRIPPGVPEGGQWTQASGLGGGGKPMGNLRGRSGRSDPKLPRDRAGQAVLSGLAKGTPDGMRKLGLHGWSNPTLEDAKLVKDEICTELTEKTGLPYNTVRTLVKTWAESSADNNVLSLQLQKAASDEFGLKLRQSVRSRLKKNIELMSDLSSHKSLENLNLTEKDARGFLRAMYNNTQKRLADSGIKELTLYRGSESFEKYEGQDIRLSGNPMQSWSVSNYEASLFGRAAVMRVPATSIISSARTGFGCLSEGEFVILVGNDSDHTATVLEA